MTQNPWIGKSWVVILFKPEILELQAAPNPTLTSGIEADLQTLICLIHGLPLHLNQQTRDWAEALPPCAGWTLTR